MATGAEAVQMRLLQIEAQIQNNAKSAMQEVMTALEGWAKAEHSYTNRTSNTTNSIQGIIEEASAHLVRGVLSAGMEYDVFLELARDGEWAFLWPVIERHKDDILKIIEGRMKL
jgi:hypothetical protein